MTEVQASLEGIRQRYVLFAVGPQKPEHDGLMQTLVRLLIKQITPDSPFRVSVVQGSNECTGHVSVCKKYVIQRNATPSITFAP